MLPVRTYLRLVQEEDINLVLAWENNQEFWQYSATTGPFSKEEVLVFINECNNLIEHTQCRYIILSDQQEALGALDLFEYDEKNKTAGIGILIAEQQDRRQGYAQSAIKNCLSQPETKRNIRMLWCLVHTDNLASQKLFESCGFVVNGKKLYRGKEALRYIYYL